jgi:hypothetical protein
LLAAADLEPSDKKDRELLAALAQLGHDNYGRKQGAPWKGRLK